MQAVGSESSDSNEDIMKNAKNPLSQL